MTHFSGSDPMFLAPYLLSGGMLLSGTGQTPFQYTLAIAHDGVYRVTYEDLNFAGQPPASDRLVISVQGVEIPVWIRDGGDGHFDAGDTISFVGRHLAGTHSYFSEYSRYNIYKLALQDRDGLRMREGNLSTQLKAAESPARVRLRLEEEKLRVTLPDAMDTGGSDSWYMSRLSHLDAQPFSWEVDLGQLPTGGPVSIQVGLAGLSRDQNAAAAGLAHHRVELSLNGILIGSGEWNGQEPYLLDVPVIDPAVLASGRNRISIHVPRRELPDGHLPVIDVSLLNWIELTYPFNSAPGNGQQAVEVGNQDATIPPLPWSESLLFSPYGHRIPLPNGTDRAVQLDETGLWYIVKGNRFLSPAWLRLDQPSELSRADQQADYLIIAHTSLAAAIAPLAEYHRQRGLKVSVVDVEDVYDEFNHGIQSPHAIRDFVSHAFHRWQRPAPRFVLLVGDASWDIHDAQAEARNLLPTMQVEAFGELAASDNGFVTVAGDDWLPDLAIGRIPAANAEELDSVVAKLLRYYQDPEVGPWRHSIAWVTDRDESFQDISNGLANETNMRGFSANLVYPPTQINGQRQEQQALRQALTDGELLVHFLGHGGRFVWRTAPPDYHDASDLFSSSDVAALPASRRLPLVLSMTCSSGPFDHPTAGSIAETFLLLPDRGAVGVLAASWRIPASQHFSQLLIEELTASGATIGEGVMKAKRSVQERALVESYNLLGDPAMQLSRPQSELALSIQSTSGTIIISAETNAKQFPDGRAIIDWLDLAGNKLKTEQLTLVGNQLEFHYPVGANQPPPSRATVYIWSTVSGQDALGEITIHD